MNKKHIEINIGNICNSKCLFCMSKYGSNFTKKEKTILNRIVNYKKQGYNSIGFVGGEPTVYKSLPKAIKLSNYLNYQNIQITTNGIKLANNEYFQKLVDNGLNNIKLSLHSIYNKKSSIITQLPNSGDKKIKCIENYNKLKNTHMELRLEVQTVINKHNYKDLLDIVKYLLENNIKSIRLQFMGYYDDYPRKNLEKSFVTYDSVLPYLKEVVDWIKDNKIKKVKIADFPICYLLDNGIIDSIYDDVLGEKYDYLDRVDDTRNGEKFSFKEKKKNDLKYYPLEKCKDCKYKFYKPCPGFYDGYLKYKKEL